MPSFALNDKFTRLNNGTRLYETEIPIIGLTGGIATGKTTVAKILVSKGFPLIDADALVKKIYSRPSSLKFIADISPRFISKNQINFSALREAVFNSPKLKKQIETFIFERLESLFQAEISSLNASFVIYDAPLLFEKKLDKLVDFSVLVYCSPEAQLDRLIKRDDISAKLAQKILEQQLCIEEKKKFADHIVDNSGTHADLKNQVDSLINHLERS